jgi:pimeloyl-ACP methyl ester carboxylesterase
VSEIVTLPDGRALSFQQSGDLDGWPVIHSHGVPGSRLDRFPDAELTRELGIRFICFDRPGYGSSDAMPGRTLVDGSGDVEALADHLNLTQFSVSAMSGGVPFALAALSSLGSRVARAALLCGLGPVDRPGAFDGMIDWNAEELRVARSKPSELEGLLSASFSRAFPTVEIETIASVAGLVEALGHSAQEMHRQGWAGVLGDDVAITRPWGFPLSAIDCPVALWHGGADALVPSHHSVYIAQRIADSELHLCPSEGHLDMYSHQGDVLAWLVP